MKKIDLPAIASMVGIVGTLAAIGFWKTVGWETPSSHDEDIHDTAAAIIEFQTRWICDEDQEELSDLLEQPTRTALEVQRVTELADNIDENDCRRF